jgi:PST family polysaccharide transporter
VAFGSYFAVGFGFLANLILTRILAPEHFGIFSLGTFFFSLLNLRPKLGIGQAFAQQKETTGELVGSHLALDVAAGLASLMVALAAVPVLRAMKYSWDIIWIMLALAGVGVSDSVGSTALLLLERELQFRHTSLLGTIVFGLSYAPALWLALHGGGYWSLVAQNVAVSIPTVLGVWWLARRRLPSVWQLRWVFDRKCAVRLLRFGIVVGASGVLAMISTSFDNYLVGTFVGLAALGFYDRAYRLAEWPNKAVTGVATRTAFYTYTRLQDDPERLARAVTMTFWLIAVVTVPLALAIFASAPDLVAWLYTERWLPSATFVRLLVVYSLVRPLLDNAGSLLVSTGHPQRATVGAGVYTAALIIAATPLTLTHGAIGTCVGVGVAFVIALLVSWHNVRRCVTVSLRDIFAAPVAAAAVSLASFLLISRGVRLEALSYAVRAITEGGFVVLAFYAVLLAVQPRQTLERAAYVWRLLLRKGEPPEASPSVGAAR